MGTKYIFFEHELINQKMRKKNFDLCVVKVQVHHEIKTQYQIKKILLHFHCKLDARFALIYLTNEALEMFILYEIKLQERAKNV